MYRWLILILTSLFLAVPFTSYGKEDVSGTIRAEFQDGIFSMDTDSSEFCRENLAPGDVVTYQYVIENHTKGIVEVRLNEIQNGKDSALYDVFDVTLVPGADAADDPVWCKLSDLHTDFEDIQPGEKQIYKVCMSLPERAGNVCQSQELHAKAVFEGRMTEPEASNQTGKAGNKGVYDRVKTGDKYSVFRFTALMVMALVLILYERWYKDDRKKK